MRVVAVAASRLLSHRAPEHSRGYGSRYTDTACSLAVYELDGHAAGGILNGDGGGYLELTLLQERGDQPRLAGAAERVRGVRDVALATGELLCRFAAHRGLTLALLLGWRRRVVAGC